MFKSFYKDIDALHQAVKPFRYRVAMNRWADVFHELVDAAGSLVQPMAAATLANIELEKALNKTQNLNL